MVLERMYPFSGSCGQWHGDAAEGEVGGGDEGGA